MVPQIPFKAEIGLKLRNHVKRHSKAEYIFSYVIVKKLSKGLLRTSLIYKFMMFSFCSQKREEKSIRTQEKGAHNIQFMN